MVGFIFDTSKGETPQSLARKREMIARMLMGQQQPQNVGQGIGALMTGIAAGFANGRMNKAETAGRQGASSAYDKIVSGITGAAPQSSSMPMQQSDAAAEIARTDPAAVNMSGNDIYSGFIDTVRASGLENPFGLAAVAATGKAESGWSPQNANRSWSDPSESGQAGTAGGIMSWRGPRLKALYDYAASKGERAGAISPQTQAEFFMRESPELVSALNNARSVEEAQSLMNNAWKFAGYNRQGGEAGRRLSLANSYLPSFEGGSSQVASLDPSVGMSAPEPFGTQALSQPGSLTDEVAAFEATPEYAAQFPGAALPQPVPPQQAQQQPAPAAPQQVAQAQSGPSLQELLTLANNPWLDEGQRSVIGTMIQQRMDEQNAARDDERWRSRQAYEQQMRQSDPAYQLGLEQTRTEIERMNRPGYRMLTGEERSTYGIPEDDTRPYQISREGQVSAVGGMGQAQTPGVEARQRAALAQEYGIDPDSAEGQRFILTGTLPTSDRGVTAGDREAIRDADDIVNSGMATLTLLDRAMELSNTAYDGAGAGWRGWLGSQFGDQGALDTLEFNNIVTEQALGQLKSIFGASPTEGERAILLEIQGSASQPQAVRDNILKRARAAVERRIAFNRDRAAELRGGTYYRPRQEPPGASPSPTAKTPARGVNIGGYTIEEVD
ncbi:MAG: hypothetical protein QHC90_25250 [Shinella sp.]|nr:hypothetical protein [Shinella sp.]